jgi:uncharacterized protein DUF3883
MALSDLNSPSAVLAAIKEFDRLGREQFLESYGFAPAKEYVLLFERQEYDSKAIAGVAHKYEFPEQGALPSDSFSGGISSGAAAKKLASLGFEIVGIKHDPLDWTLRECELTAEAYFECLAEHLKGRETNKASLYRELSNRLNHRSAKAVEYKFQNISAILIEEGLPTLGRPKSNYQSLLKAVVRDYVRSHPDVFEVVPESLPVPRSAREIFVAPPLPKKDAGTNTAARNKVRPIDFAERDAENKKLGENGERWVIECEKKRLIDAGKSELAKKVLWVSRDMGDGYGYDIASFTCTGDPILIEVKTTNGVAARPFYISEAELGVADNEGQRYRLYRVFDFAGMPQIFELVGPLRQRLSLIATSYRAAVG